MTRSATLYLQTVLIKHLGQSAKYKKQLSNMFVRNPSTQHKVPSIKTSEEKKSRETEAKVLVNIHQCSLRLCFILFFRGEYQGLQNNG